MERLIIKNGKFYRRNEEIPIEIGNADQIKVYKKHVNITEKFKNGVDISVDTESCGFDVTVSFVCADCNQTIKYKTHTDERDSSEMIDESITCKECNADYVFRDGDFESMIAFKEFNDTPEEEVEVDVKYDSCGYDRKIFSTCVNCERDFSKNMHIDEDEDYDLTGMRITCPECSIEYVLSENDYGEMVAKIEKI